MIKGNCSATVETKADLLIEALFSLGEPWKSNFLAYVAWRMVGDAWDGDTPGREEIEMWLGNQRLRREVELMLSSWRGLKPLA